MTNLSSWNQIEFATLKGFFTECRVTTPTRADAKEPTAFPTFGSRTILEAMPQLLAWDDFNEALKSICIWQLDYVYSELLRVCGPINDVSPGRGEWLKESLNALPDWALARVLGAPETSRRIAKIRHGTSDHISFFQSAILAEEILQGRNSPQPCWSGLGDFYFAGSTVCDPRYHDWNPERSLFAPRLESLIPVDFLSPHARNINSLPHCPFLPYTPQETAAVWRDLHRAMSHVAAINQNAWHLIRRFVRVIVPRINPIRPSGSGASSTPSHIGRLLIRNSHLMSVEDLMDSFVHEAIHALLFVIEICESFVTDPSANQVLIRSPWSNNLLPIQTYIHACFVWYGLANFWAHAELSGLLEPDVANSYKAMATSGFKIVNPVDELIPHCKLVRANAMKIVGSLHNSLRERQLESM